MITYKLVRCRRGLYYPLFVETDRSMPIGIWLDAQVGELEVYHKGAVDKLTII